MTASDVVCGGVRHAAAAHGGAFVGATLSPCALCVRTSAGTTVLFDAGSGAVVETVCAAAAVAVRLPGGMAGTYTTVSVRDGGLWVGDERLGGVGQRLMSAGGGVAEDEAVADVHALEVVRGAVDLVVVGSGGSVWYYRSVSGSSWLRLDADFPPGGCVPSVVAVPSAVSPHRLLVTGSAPVLVHHVHGYPTVVPLALGAVPVERAAAAGPDAVDVVAGGTATRVVLRTDQTVDGYALPYVASAFSGTPHYVASHGGVVFVVGSVTEALGTADTPPQLPHSSTQPQQLDEPPRLYASASASAVYVERFFLTRLDTGDTVWFQQGYVVTSVAAVTVDVGGRSEAYVAVGIHDQTTEDYPVKGRTELYAYGAGLQLVTNVGDGKRAVSCVRGVGEYLAVGAGNELQIMRGVEARRWEKVCFTDLSISVRGIASLPVALRGKDGAGDAHLVLITDFYRSVVLLLFQPRDTVTVLGKDRRNMHALDAAFLPTKDFFMILEADFDMNISVLTYSSTQIERTSIFGVDATFNVGQHVLHFTRVRSGPGYVHFYVTAEGSIGTLCAVDEQSYNVLRQINAKMNREPWHFAGTNPEEFRAEKGRGAGYGTRPRVILDGDVLRAFRGLGPEQRRRVCLRNTPVGEALRILNGALARGRFLY